jgi:hypothetical protein
MWMADTTFGVFSHTGRSIDLPDSAMNDSHPFKERIAVGSCLLLATLLALLVLGVAWELLSSGPPADGIGPRSPADYSSESAHNNSSPDRR